MCPAGRPTSTTPSGSNSSTSTTACCAEASGPEIQVVRLRALLRHRERVVEYAAAHIQHMQKALMQMNVQLHHVVSDITGVTGMKIIREIVEGVRDPKLLAQTPRRPMRKETVETIGSTSRAGLRQRSRGTTDPNTSSLCAKPWSFTSFTT